MSCSKKTKQMLKVLTIEEKAALLSGKTVWETRDIPRLQIPSVTCSDGPNGIRRQVGKGDHLGLNSSLSATCFPTSATIGNSWDIELAEQIGAALGSEAAALGVDILLGPGLNIKRSPLCGRNFEYFSEDPYLSGKLAAGYVRGIQSQGVAACPKHFAVNSQEERRMSMNAVLDERTLREIYLTGFEIAVKEGGAQTLMTSYNEVNGVYANENKHLLQDILRDDWGFEGIVITDWGGSNDHIAGVAAGSNLEMPTPGFDSAISLVQAWRDGKITEKEIDRCVEGLLEVIFSLKDKNSPGTAEPAVSKEDAREHHKLAERAAAESIVLLKNEDGILPLDPNARTAVIGDFARKARYQGAGSSNVNSIRQENVTDLLEEYPILMLGYAQGYRRNSPRDPKLEEEALAIASQADQILYFSGLDEIIEAEGMERKHMKLPENQIALLKKLAGLGKKVIAVLNGGSSIEMPWENCCAAIVHGYLGGQAGAGAMLKVLTGQVNPSGKLNETYPVSYEDTPAFNYYPAKFRDSQYRESIYVGYRYYDTADIKVQYPFGYGLSYTSFEYSELTVTQNEAAFILKNTGERDGAEVAQLYVGCRDGKVFRPVRELKGFTKVFLKAGEEKKVSVPLDEKAFRYWDVKTGRWEVEEGEYQIMIGASSRDIRLTAALSVKGTTDIIPYSRSMMESYYTGKIRKVPDAQFAALMGGKIPQERTTEELTVNDALCQMEKAKSPLARLIYRILTNIKDRSEEKGKPDLNVLFIYNIPFRGIAKMTNGIVSMKMAEGMVTVVNGHFFKGMGHIIRGFFENRKANRQFARKLSEGEIKH